MADSVPVDTTDAEPGTADGKPADTGGPAGGTAGKTTGDTADKTPDGKGDRKAGGKFARQTLIILVAAAVLTMLLKVFVVQVFVIPSASMENTLMTGDRVLVNKLTYDFRGIHRGDIIVFSGAGTWGDLNGNPIPPLPGNPVARAWDETLAAVGLRSDTTDYIKRVIGLPGDHVACCTDDDITVNGVKLNESSFIIPATAGDPEAAASASIAKFSITVPPGRLWVMGDNRTDSDDSMFRYTQDGYSLMRSTIPEHEVAGRAFFVIWPLSQFGDLPIPAVFQQAALNAAPAAAGLGLATTPLLISRWRRRRSA